MSREKNSHEADRWLRQALADVQAAESSLRGGSCEWACFQAQQAGEKAIKAVWFASGADPWGHSLTQLIGDFPVPSVKDRLMAVLDAAKTLDKFYIPTRYPNGLPDSIPADVYTVEDAKRALGAVALVIAGARKELNHEEHESQSKQRGRGVVLYES
jgi:HEPN domain-containing protein